MKREQVIAILVTLVLFFTMYFGCDITPRKKSKNEETTSVSKSVDIESVIKNARQKLPQPAVQKLDSLEKNLAKLKGKERSEILKQISKTWFDNGQSFVAADYARQIAEIEKTEDTWSVAGGNYYLATQNAGEDKALKDQCTGEAVHAFEEASKLNPDNISYKINMALCYTENPPAENPMKGILLLRELDQKYPGNPSVLIQLGRLAIKTGQFDKAVTRLEAALAKSPDDMRVICLLAEAYQGAGNTVKAKEMAAKCKQ